MADRNIASDGSGSTSSSPRSSAPLLIFALPLLVIGLFLLALAKRGWRVTCSVGLGLCAALTCWGILVDSMPQNRVYSSSILRSDLIIAVSTAAAYIVFSFLGLLWLWPLGIIALGWSGGASLAMSILLMADNLTIQKNYGIWIFVGAFGLAGILSIAVLLNHAVPICGAMTGSFILFLAVDLLANEDKGWSRGLRLMLDYNPSHRPLLKGYHPPLSSRILLGLCWLLAILAAIMQLWLFKGAFIPPKRRNIVSMTEKLVPAQTGQTAQLETHQPDPVPTIAAPVYSPPSIRTIPSHYSLRSHRSTSASMFSAVTQQVRIHWKGAWSQYSSSTDVRSHPSSIMRPLRLRNPDLEEREEREEL